ncbi:MAG: glycosyl transferase family 1, partial [Planctomycetaceae bacterium]|nr:glycosyl transferase family 1 [Planctomycetaceae bacterium]
MSPRQRILFMSEAVTLCHFARPRVLADAIDPASYEVHFAAPSRLHSLLSDVRWTVHDLDSLEPKEFLSRLANGVRLYEADTLERQVRRDLELIDATAPDLIVGDFRLSLSASARLRHIPYITVTNAYWSPYGRQRYPLPDIPLARSLGPAVGGAVFRLIRPAAFAHLAAPLNHVRRKFGLRSLGSDLRLTYTDADYVAYADVGEVVRTYGLPDNHVYLGPINWSYPIPATEVWDRLDPHKPLIYANLGSSGRDGTLETVLQALGGCPFQVL